MKKRTFLTFLLACLPLQASALGLDDISDKSKPLFTDISVTAQHQYYIGTVFDSLNKYLCSLAQNRHENHANLMKDVNGSTAAYRAILDDVQCGMAARSTPRLVLAEQESTDSEMTVQQWAIGGVGGIYPYAMRAKVIEEATEGNPFGIMEFDIEVLSGVNNPETVYKFRSTSTYADSDTVDVKLAMYLDQVIVDNTKELNTEAQFFSANLEHDLDDSGRGTIVAKFFSPRGDSRLYPEGIPVTFRAIDVDYNAQFLRYRVTLDYYLAEYAPIFVENGGYYLKQYDEGEVCIKRSDPWQYVDKFGIYDDQGDQNTETFTAQYTSSDGTVYELNVDGMDFSTPMVCRAWADGTVTGEDAENCSGVYRGISNGANLRSVEPPDYAQIVRSDGVEGTYLIRRLLTRNVFEQVPLEECESLTIGATREAPNHLFYTEESLLDFSWPLTGAPLVNLFEEDNDNDPSGYKGAWYSPLGDYDEDGVLNYVDAFPEDPEKSGDLDYDGVADDQDITEDVISYDHSDIFFPNAVEHLSPSAAQP